MRDLGGREVGPVAVAAVDERQRSAAAALAERGVPVQLWTPAEPGKVRLARANALLAPFRGLPAAALPALDLLPAGAVVLTGLPDPALAAAAECRGLRYHAYATGEAFALANAVPTAEGAILEACRLAGRTVAGACTGILGYGRCGQAIADRVTAWHGQALAVTRRPESRALATARGAVALGWTALPRGIASCDFVFNTVPAPVLGQRELAVLRRGACIIDLASAPGGVDLAAAESLGLPARLLPGLPGRLFPDTAGRIVADAVLALLQSEV